jgi:hypothetical protein
MSCPCAVGLQGIGISAINSMGKISDPEDGQALQNFMICCEMALAGIALLYAFPHKEYQIGGSTSGYRLEAFMHAISVHDVVKDAIHVVRRTPAFGAQHTCATS